MKKLTLILLFFLIANIVFGSSQKYSAEKCYGVAYEAFIDVTNFNEKATEQEIQESEEALLYFNENIPGFKEQAVKAYIDIMEEIKNNGNAKAMTELKRIGYKLGFDQEQQSNTGTTSTGKSSCCLLL